MNINNISFMFMTTVIKCHFVFVISTKQCQLYNITEVSLL